MNKEFTPAYTITNENWRWARAQTAGAQNVLTVAGSGDQALTYKLTGAQNVDTYDITKCAHMIQDIKTTAIQMMPRDQYTQLMRELYYAHKPLDLVSLSHVMKNMPAATVAEMRANADKVDFGAGCPIDSYPENQFTDAEYAKLKTLVTKPFNFINSDIANLHAKLTTEYDLIDISNIFDYGMDGTTQANILGSLIKHVRIGGRIVYLPQMAQYKYDGINIHTHNMTLAHQQTIAPARGVEMVIFQRTR